MQSYFYELKYCKSFIKLIVCYRIYCLLFVVDVVAIDVIHFCPTENLCDCGGAAEDSHTEQSTVTAAHTGRLAAA